MQFTSTIKTPAKINAGLIIPFRYPNGYHHIISYFIPINFYDTIKITFMKDPEVRFRWKSFLPTGYEKTIEEAFEHYENNLMIKTWQWLKTFSKKKEIISDLESFFKNHPGIDIEIEKRIPSPSGLGGGSSNAAGLIKAFFLSIQNNDFPKSDLEKDINTLKLNSIKLGSDIPFFLQDHSALISGIGEVHSLYPTPNLAGIIAIPSFGFSTKQMYSQLKKTLQTDSKTQFFLSKFHREFASLIEFFENKMDLADIKSNDIIETRENYIWLTNEFWDAAKQIFPKETERINNALKACIKIFNENDIRPIISMTGSGSAFYAITSQNKTNPEEMMKIQKKLNKRVQGFYWIIV